MKDPARADRLAAIKARRAAITPAPWRVYRCSYCSSADAACGIRNDEQMEQRVSYTGVVYDTDREECLHPLDADDALFIASAPDDIDWLLEQLEALL